MYIQVNLFQKHLFLHQLTHDITKYCSWNYHENYKLRACCVHKLCFCFDIQNNLCTQHVLPNHVLTLQFSRTTNNLLSYCGLVYARISASEKDLPVCTAKSYRFAIRQKKFLGRRGHSSSCLCVRDHFLISSAQDLTIVWPCCLRSYQLSKGCKEQANPFERLWSYMFFIAGWTNRKSYLKIHQMESIIHLYSFLLSKYAVYENSDATSQKKAFGPILYNDPCHSVLSLVPP